MLGAHHSKQQEESRSPRLPSSVCVYIDPRMQPGFLLNIYLSTSRRMYDSVFGRW